MHQSRYPRIIFFSLIIMAGFFVFSTIIRPTTQAKTNQEEIAELNQKIEERKDKIKQLEESIETYKKNIEEKKLETVSLRNQLSILDNHMSRIEADIELTDEKIKKTQLEIDAAKLRIEEKEKVIAKQKELIAKMLRDVNKEQDKDYFEVLLTNTSLSDFFNQVQYLETVYQDLGSTVKTLRIVKDDLEKQKKLSEEYKKEQQDLKTKYVLQKQDLTDQTNYKNNLLAETKWSEWRYTTLLANLKNEYQKIEDEVRSYEREVQQKLAAKDNNTVDLSDTTLTWPTASHYITAYFHDPEYPYRNVFEHSGIDLAASHGSVLRAAASGYVARAKTCTTASCYSYVLIVHTGNLSTLYGHMSQITVSEDQFVNKGDIIGYSGGTPGTIGAGNFVTGPHLHFEVRLNGIPVNPLNYLTQ